MYEMMAIVFYDHQQVAVNGSMSIRDQNGVHIAYVGGPVQTSGAFRPLGPGKSAVLFDKLDVASQYYIGAPGRYTVEFSGRGLAVGISAAGSTEDLPDDLVGIGRKLPSNVVEIEVGVK